ncbi:MAG: Fic family protein [Clostridia bacterium]|nr:Fic family protein [Clostridia bacterium]
MLSWFCDDFALRFCWSSNAIEGNTLSLDETVALIEYDEVRSGHTYSEYREAKDLYRAIKEMLLPFGKTPVSEDWIKKSNSLITGTTGEYRSVPVKIGSLIETVYIPPSAEKVPALMKDFLENVNFEAETLLGIASKAAKLHLDFERIHPFLDGNGRTGRMILNKQLINHGLLPITLGKTGSYRRSFRIYDRNGDTSLLVHEILSEEAAALGRLRELYEKLDS